MWNHEPRYSKLNGQPLLDYAHRHGVWLTDSSVPKREEVAEKLAAKEIGDGEIRRRIRIRQEEINAQRGAWASIAGAIIFDRRCCLMAREVNILLMLI